jgi:beta-galactosidase
VTLSLARRPVSALLTATFRTAATTAGDNNAQFTVKVTNSLGSVTLGAATLTVVAPAAAAITAQPANRTAFVGQTATFSVTATGSPALAYQWRRNGTAITGATAASYVTPVLAAADNGASYTVVVTNPINSVTSAAAVLTVQPAVPPTITQQPASVSVRGNDAASFAVLVGGTAPFTYQWRFNGANILGANGSTFTIAQAQNGDAGAYTVVVTNAAGSATSAAATLTIAPPGVDLALHQAATASSVQGGGLEATRATDGDLATRWASAGGVDPSWLQVDLGGVKAFNTVVLSWEAAFAAQYQIQVSNDAQTWSVAASNTSGHGGVETLSFPTVQGRFVRMFGQVRATSFGYSLFELAVYNVAQCGGAGERYTVLSGSRVKDNVSGLTWQRAQTTFTDPGAQFTQPIAQSTCASASMRLPTRSEALGIAGDSSAACAFPLPWSTWTSTADPADATRAFVVSYTGQSTSQVANNFPGAVVCTSGSTVAAPAITTQPASTTVAVGQAATFSVVASGGTLAYQWSRNGAAIAGATAATYTTPPTTTADSGAQFTVAVSNAGGTTVSSAATLTVTGGATGSLLSQGKPATASSVEGGFVAANAVDGNTGTRWASAFSNSEWISIDLGATATITRVVLTWETAFASGYQIQTAASASGPWTTIFSTTTGDGGIDDLNVSGSGRFVRMNGTQRATGFGYSLFEFQVFGTQTGAGTLLSQGKPATASSVEGGFVAANAVDGDTATRWGSAFTNSEWIAVDLGATATITRVVLTWETAFASGYQIQTAASASGPWTTIFSTTTGDGDIDDLSVSGSGRFVRMNGTQRATSFGYSLFEFQVFGP